MSNPTPKQPSHLKIGVLLPSPVQLLNLSPVDLLAMLSPDYLKACKLPQPLINLGIPSTVYTISHPSITQIQTTANINLQIRHSLLSPEVSSGNLDILLIPGPDPSLQFEKEVLEFVRGHVSFGSDDDDDKDSGRDGKGKRKCDVLCICTGIFILAQAGVLEGKKASGPRALVGKLKGKWPGTLWNENRRWVQDGNLWTSGGITNGQEMVSSYMRQNFPGPTTEAVLAMADVGNKGVSYTKSVARENLWWLWHILRAVRFGFVFGKKEKKVK